MADNPFPPYSHLHYVYKHLGGSDMSDPVKRDRELARREGVRGLGLQYAGKSKDQVQQLIGRKKLTPAQLAEIQADKLTFRQNMSALGHELKGQKYTPGAVLKRGWQNMGEGSGGWRGGNEAGRYVGLGGKSLTGIFAVGDLKDAVNRVDPEGRGRSRTERLGSAAGGVLGTALGTIGAARTARLGKLGLPASMIAGIGGMMGGYYLGGKAGKYTDKAVSKARGVQAGDRMSALKRRAGI